MGQDLADVVSTGAEHGEEGIADGAFQRACGEATVGFHVADLGLDGAAAAEVSDQPGRQPAASAADQDAGPCLATSAVTAVDDGHVGTLVGQDGHLFQRGAQGVAVMGSARKAAHADHEAFVQGGGDADLTAELVTEPRLARGYAGDRGLMPGVDLVGPLGLLMQQL